VPIQLSTLCGFLEEMVAVEHLGQREGRTVRAQRGGPLRQKLVGGFRVVAAGPPTMGLRWCFSARRLDIAPGRQVLCEQNAARLLVGPLVT